MEDTILQYKCPCCGGAIEFDSRLQKMKCPYCDTEFELETLKSYDDGLKGDKEDELNWSEPETEQWREGETDGMRIYICSSCGGEIAAEEVNGALSCPYCGNPVILKGQFSGELRPDYVIPFKLDKNAAKSALKKHLEGKRLLPRVFKSENHIDEIKGIYVPFWLFDTDADARIRYNATTVRTWEDSHYINTETCFYSLLRSGSLGFDNVPVDASSKMPDDLMESIEPFDYSQAVDFQTAYLSGYLADIHDVDAQKCSPRANERVKASTEERFRQTISPLYATVTPASSSVSINGGKPKYALLPVWILNTSWKGQKFTFAMNGQTGKFVGNLPVDKGIYYRWFAGIAAVSAAAAYALMYLIMM